MNKLKTEITDEFLDKEGKISLAEDKIVLNGETLNISSGSVLIYNSLTIELGGTLMINGPLKDWAEIYIQGNFKVHGEIIVRNFRTPIQYSETIEREAFDGRILKFTYTNNNKGGNGGNGGNHIIQAVGGKGSIGHFLYGGGGGGGAGCNQGSARACVPTGGGNGNQNIGGTGGGGTGQGGIGGNGARRSNIGDGGLLYISISGTVDGNGGIILCNGENGKNGKNGTKGDSYRGGQGGGGGAGGPGNHGGCVIFAAKLNNIIALPDINTNGGAGGIGGIGGTGWHNSGIIGTVGEQGNNGQFLLKRFYQRK
jgi:hypothetical protein